MRVQQQPEREPFSEQLLGKDGHELTSLVADLGLRNLTPLGRGVESGRGGSRGSERGPRRVIFFSCEVLLLFAGQLRGSLKRPLRCF